MEHKLTITLPDAVYQPLVEAALEQGRTPEEVAAEQLSRVLPKANGEKRGSIKEFFGTVSLGHPTGADNESIDRDLAREYAARHEDAG